MASRKTTTRAKTARKSPVARSKRGSGGAKAEARRPRVKRISRKSAQSHLTVDHDEIREWAEERGGHPSTVKRTERGREPGILRIDFPGFSGERTLEEISWDDFFDKFEENGLAFLYQERTAGGKPSRFNKFVSRETARKKKAA